jgi:hypothetical protein
LCVFLERQQGGISLFSLQIYNSIPVIVKESIREKKLFKAGLTIKPTFVFTLLDVADILLKVALNTINLNVI